MGTYKMVKKSIYFHFFKFSFVLFFVIDAAECQGQGVIPFGNSCYFVNLQPITYLSARDECLRLGFTLASILSEAENDFVNCKF